MKFKELYDVAKSFINPRKISKTTKVGMVACALETDNGNIYTGVCAEISCALGYCAEQAAVSSMITAGDSSIKKIVAVYRDGKIIAPCGKCRELLFHVNHDNYYTTQIMLSADKIVKLCDILPESWYLDIETIRDNNVKKMGDDYV